MTGWKSLLPINFWMKSVRSQDNDKLKIVYKSIDELSEYPDNPRNHDDEKIGELVERIKRTGWATPIEIDEAGMILSGHGRMLAAKQLDMKKVPCVVLEGMTEAQKAEHVIASNRVAEHVDWDYSNLAVTFDFLEKCDVDPVHTGFDASHISDILDFTNRTAGVNKEPTQSQSLVTEDQVQKANVSVNTPTIENKQSIVCPHCTEEFFI